MRKVLFVVVFSFLFISANWAQDKGEFRDRSNPFFKEMISEINSFNEDEKKANLSFAVVFDGVDIPKSPDQFKQYWHTAPHSQGFTGTCWAHAMISYFEAEVYRMSGKKVRLSEMFTVYWEYIEKAEGFIETRGKSNFAEGSEGNAVARVWNKYGIVPQSDYTGMKEGQKFHDHREMFKEMSNYLMSVKEQNAWNKNVIIETIKSILNSYMGVPPTEITADDKTYTPKEYLNNYLKLNPDDYVDILSYKQQPYNKFVEYEVADNWWHNKDYFNVPLDDFMTILKKVLREGYTVPIGGDVSEAGIDGQYEAAIVPSFDIPSEYINDDARQFRFSNGTTTDDHGIHIVGYMTNDDGQDWYLIKDSGGRAFQGPNKGYMFYSEDYVKLKIMDFTVKKELVSDLLK